MHNENYMYYCENLANRMYPRDYQELYPYVQQACEREDYPNNPEMYPFPNEEKVNTMVEDIYEEYENGNKKLSREKSEKGEYEDLYRRRRDGTRDLIRILLLRELLGRRRRRFPRRRHYYPYGGYDWYNGYNGYGGFPGIF